MASKAFRLLLDKPIPEEPAWSARKRSGNPESDPENCGFESPLGRTEGTWELVKLGIEISERTVSRLMPKRRKPPSQSWRTSLDHHVGELVSIDFLTVPTATFRVLFVLVVLAHDRRKIVHFNVTEHPTAEWTARQLIRVLAVGMRTPIFCRGVVRRPRQSMSCRPDSPWLHSHSSRYRSTA